MEWQLEVRNDSFDRAGITKDKAEAICEYIWNGFEAGATKVVVSKTGEALKEAYSIIIEDNGNGINHQELQNTFGAFLASSKANTSIRIKSQPNKGKGRFSYLAFTSSASLVTNYRDENGVMKKYSIKLDSASRNTFETSELTNSNGESGTIVELPIADSKDDAEFSYNKMHNKLLEEFAWFLYLNRDKGVSLKYCENDLNYLSYIDSQLSKDITIKIDENDFNISLIVWKSKVANSSKIYYMNNDGILKHTDNTSFNNNTIDFYHAVFLKSDYFNDNIPVMVDTEDSLIEFKANQRAVMKELKRQIKKIVDEAMREFLIIKAELRLKDMEDNKSFPSFSNDDYGQLRKKDFVRVTKELYCTEPKIFYKLNRHQEKSLLGFLNLLLSSDERENILAIVDEVVSLTTEQRKKFADILKRSSLEHVLDVIDLIQKRCEVILQLKKIIFDLKEFANERDHIQKIIEQHYWLFGEQYNLVTADKQMRTSLLEYEKLTEVEPSNNDTTMSEAEQIRRLDIFLYSSRFTEDEKKETLVIELKAPNIVLSQKVLTQIVEYANIIRKEERFQSHDRVWKFIAICAKVHEDVKIRYRNYAHLGKRCLVDMIENFEIYAMSWDDIFTNFELRHDFLLSKLKMNFEQSSEPQEKLEATRKMVDDLTTRLASLKLAE